MMNYGGMNAGGAIFWMVTVVALVALVVWAIVRVGNPPRARDAGAVPPDHARETRERRFAQGEIDDNEYQRRRDLLTPHASRR